MLWNIYVRQQIYSCTYSSTKRENRGLKKTIRKEVFRPYGSKNHLLLLVCFLQIRIALRVDKSALNFYLRINLEIDRRVVVSLFLTLEIKIAVPYNIALLIHLNVYVSSLFFLWGLVPCPKSDLWPNWSHISTIALKLMLLSHDNIFFS